MNSINEQIAYIQSIKNDFTHELENNPKVNVDKVKDESVMLISIIHSLESLKQKIDTDLDFFVAVMNKDDYKKFIDFKEQK